MLRRASLGRARLPFLRDLAVVAFHLNRLDRPAQSFLVAALDLAGERQEVASNLRVAVEVGRVERDKVLVVRDHWRRSAFHEQLHRLQVAAERRPVQCRVSELVLCVQEGLLVFFWPRVKV